eukprot:comp20226_c0_seq2/m.40087 comp20226_c0_seq2/g.40087  ORF comp20226_c0_seq2/g.40087 comp20226_c0_seq2/m.40087 type:complete len:163 (+) comp20226_c0_seq2:342-830(+)
MLYIFAGLLLILIVAQIGVAGYAVKNKGKIESILRKGWDSDQQSDRKYIQDKFHCCGFNAESPGSDCPSDSKGYCYVFLKDAFNKDLHTIEIIGYSVVAFELFMVISTVVLMCGIRDHKGYTQLENEYLLQSTYDSRGPTQMDRVGSSGNLYPNLRADLGRK